eukprot:1878349-Lingulodinium_polyedra.AAC.1
MDTAVAPLCGLSTTWCSGAKRQRRSAQATLPRISVRLARGLPRIVSPRNARGVRIRSVAGAP